MIGVIFATLREAAPFVHLAGQRRLKGGAPALYGHREDASLLTFVCGMGPAAADFAARTAVEDYGAGRLINAGICGALRTGPPWTPGAVFAVSIARYIDDGAYAPDATIGCDRDNWHHLPAAELVTRRAPVFDAGLRAALARWGALVDMEGAAIAAYAHESGLPCSIIKGITDDATEMAQDDLHRRLAGVSRQIAGILDTRLRSSGPLRHHQLQNRQDHDGR